MKTAWLSSVVLFAAAACVPNGSVRNNQQGNNFQPDTAASSFPDPTPAPSLAQDMSPKMVLPATGGVPVVGIPLGGNMFLPATGGPPVVGIPISP